MRTDHFLKAFLPTTVENLLIADGVILSVKMPLNGEDSTQIMINNVTTKIPISYYLDAKYDVSIIFSLKIQFYSNSFFRSLKHQ